MRCRSTAARQVEAHRADQRCHCQARQGKRDCNTKECAPTRIFQSFHASSVAVVTKLFSDQSLTEVCSHRGECGASLSCHPGRAQREPGPMRTFRVADGSHESRVAPLRSLPGMTSWESGS